MPIDLVFYNNGVLLNHYGIITDEELLRIERDIYNHHYPEPLQFQIVDLSNVLEFRASGDTMRLLGQEDREVAKTRGRQHIVVIAPPHCRAHTIIWQAWAQDIDSIDPAIVTCIVNTADEACLWLKNNGVIISESRPLSSDSS